MKYRMIISDVDGTLVDENQNVSKTTVDAVERYISAGGFFTIATGRMESAVLRFQNELGLNAPAILYNGARIVDVAAGRVVYEQQLTPLQVKTAAEMLKEYPMDGIMYQDGKAFILETTEALREHAAKDRVVLNEINSFYDLVLDRITKVLMIGDNSCFDEFITEYLNRVELSPEFVQSEADYLEILPQGVDKGTALGVLADSLDLKLEEVICVGDNLNDLGMIRKAGLGAAVANAHAEVIAAAGRLLPSNLDNGVAALIDDILG